MYAPMFGGPSRAGLYVIACDVPVKQPITDEAKLVQRLRAGDETAFRELVERYGPRIYRVAYGILRNPDDADDIAQEVFAKVYFSIKSFQARSSLYTWISRIAINQCYGLLRKKRPIHESDSADGSFSMRTLNIADVQPRADLAVMQRDFINKLLTQVSEDERLLLIWKEVEGFSLAELSEMTGLGVNTVKVRLFRARQKLVRAAAQSGGRRL
jgi:RNA polymerase sigma-70 factor (ECF subfamily)